MVFRIETMVQILIIKPIRQAHTNSEVEQTDTNSSSEEHREVRSVTKIRFVGRFSQFHVAVFGEVQHDDEDSPDIL